MNKFYHINKIYCRCAVLVAFILLQFINGAIAQINELELGKAEFTKNAEDQDFKRAVELLENAVRIEPGNAEAHYFLGYAYDKLNARDGKDMANADIKLTIKASHEFETVNKLTPKYEGSYLVLDPYSKISSIWGSQAMAYMYRNKLDSARWAFSEGRKRNGFGDLFLAVNRQILNTCSSGSYLISSGDNFTFPLWYLQLMEGQRPDVFLIDISLLNTNWYPDFLLREKKINLSLTKDVLDSLEYCIWNDSIITIPIEKADHQFNWTVKPNYMDAFMLRGGRIFLNLIETNKFEKDIYFTTAFNKADQLGLDEHFDHYFLMDKVVPVKNTNWSDYVIAGINSFDFSNLDADRIINSVQELNMINVIRYEYCLAIQELIKQDRNTEAKELYKKLNSNIPESKYPFTNRGIETFIQQLNFD